MKKIIIFGSIFAVVILALTSFNSVATAQTMDDSSFNKFIDKFMSHLQEDEGFKDFDVNEMGTMLQNLKDSNISGSWYPSYWFGLLLGIIGDLIGSIYLGEWFPGRFTFNLLFLIGIFLFWLVNWGPDT